MGKRFKLEALQVEELVEKGVLELVDTPGLKQRSDQIMRMANKCLGAHGHALHLMHGGECETLAAASLMRAEAIFIDERITRLLVESPERLAELMGHRLHTRVNLDNRQVKEFRSLVGKPDLMRSAELVLIAYEKGLLDRYKVRIKNVERELVDSLLWGVKLHGCAISVPDIEHLTEEVLR